jgi:hypothetical protein
LKIYARVYKHDLGTRQNSFGEVVNECLPKADAAREYTPIFAPISERFKGTIA